MTVYKTSRRIGTLRTRLFDMEEGRDMKRLARLVGLSLSQVYRIREGKRRIGESFIVGALTAFPKLKFSDLFYIHRNEKDTA